MVELTSFDRIDHFVRINYFVTTISELITHEDWSFLGID